MRSFLLSLAILPALLIMPAWSFAGEDAFGSLTVQQVKAKIGQKNVYVFDNNAPEVFQDAHLPGAKWLSPSDYDAKALPADKSATLIFYCHNEH
jgi:hypothetical protein